MWGKEERISAQKKREENFPSSLLPLFHIFDGDSHASRNEETRKEEKKRSNLSPKQAQALAPTYVCVTKKEKDMHKPPCKLSPLSRETRCNDVHYVLIGGADVH